jgi:hypothetical protein
MLQIFSFHRYSKLLFNQYHEGGCGDGIPSRSCVLAQGGQLVCRYLRKNRSEVPRQTALTGTGLRKDFLI